MIIKHPRPRRWTAVDRRTINDERLSFRARGVLLWLLDKPNDWQWTSTTIAEEGVEGRDAVRTALGELESCGYIARRREQGKDGRWFTEVWVYERPEDAEEPTPDFQAPVTDNQASVFPSSVSQALSTSRTETETEREDALFSKLCKQNKSVADEWAALLARHRARGLSEEKISEVVALCLDRGEIWPSKFERELEKCVSYSHLDWIAQFEYAKPKSDCPKCEGKGWYWRDDPGDHAWVDCGCRDEAETAA
jgi:hypothetical protein